MRGGRISLRARQKVSRGPGRETRGHRVKFFGKEPVVTPGPMSENELGRFLNWHSNVSSREEAQAWLAEYYDGVDRSLARRIRALNERYVPTTCAWCARAMSLGATFPPERIARWDALLRERLEKASGWGRQDLGDGEAPRRTIQDSVARVVSELCTVINGLIDDRGDVDVEAILRARNASAVVAERVASRYRPELEDLSATLSRADEDCLHEVRGYSSEDLAWILSTLESVVEGATRYADNRKRARAPARRRATTRVNPERVAGRLRYLRESASLRVTSLNPIKVIGAAEAWLFNTKSGILSLFRGASMDDAGLSAKGLSIANYDKNASIAFYVSNRKRSDVISRVANASTRDAIAALEKTPGVRRLPGIQHRTSEHTLFVKVA